MEENIQKTKKISLNKTWILIIGLIILTAILLVISITTKSFSPNPKSPTTEEEKISTASLSISEEPRETTTSGKYEIDVLINVEEEVSGVQLELSFDPEALSGVDIKSGDFITSPNVLIKNIDQKTGVIRFVQTIKQGTNPVKGTGVVATISYSKTTPGETFLNFLPQSQVSSPKYPTSILGNTISGIITDDVLTSEDSSN